MLDVFTKMTQLPSPQEMETHAPTGEVAMRVLLYALVVGAGLGIGSVIGFIVGLFTGIIPFGC